MSIELTPCTLYLKCIFLSKRLRETRASGQRRPSGGIHATSRREICTAQYVPAERERVLLALPDPDCVGLVEQLLLLVLRHLERLDLPAQRGAVPVRVAMLLPLLERPRVWTDVGLLLLLFQPVDGVEALWNIARIDNLKIFITTFIVDTWLL